MTVCSYMVLCMHIKDMLNRFITHINSWYFFYLIPVIAIKNILAAYGLNRISWQGDPCVPKQFLWTGLRCNYIDLSTPPTIVAL